MVNEGKEVYLHMVKQFYVILKSKSRSNDKVIKVLSMVNKKEITITLKDIVIYLMVPLRGEDVFKIDDRVNLDMNFYPNEQYEILFK
jgi:cell division septal protein FtsQ